MGPNMGELEKCGHTTKLEVMGTDENEDAHYLARLPGVEPPTRHWAHRQG